MSNQTGGPATGLDDPAAVIGAIVNDVANMDVEPDQSFFDLGLDSIQLMDICNRITERFGDVIDLFLLFENPTVAECAAIVRDQPAG